MENQSDVGGKKIYTAGWTAFGTYLGGPLAGAYFLSKNFETFGEKEAARRSLLIGVTVTIFLFGSIVFIPGSLMDKVPKSVIPTTYTAFIYWYAATYQKKNIDTHTDAGGKTYSGWRVAGISLLCLIPAIISLFASAAIAVLVFGMEA